MRKRVSILASALLALAGFAQAQNTTTLQVAVNPEAALTVTTGTTALSTTGTNFTVPYTGTTNFTYQIRTTKTTGTGTLTLKVTSDFGGTGGPSVGTPPTTGDALSYTPTISNPGTAAAAGQTASTSASTPVGTWGAGASSTKAGNSGSVAWSLTDDPVYATGTYNATVTLTISAT